MASASRLESLVGGDLHEAERKKDNTSEPVIGEFNVIITANSRLFVHLKGDREAWERRLAIIEYEHGFSGKTVPDIHEKLLKEEGPGILNWYLEGFGKLPGDIAGETGTMVLTKNQIARVHTVLSESDGLRIYIREHIVKTSGGENLTGAEIIQAYGEHCNACGWIPSPVKQAEKDLADLMLELFATKRVKDIKRDNKSQRGFRNVRFRQLDEEDPP